MHILSIFEPQSTILIIFTILGGLGLFLFGIDYMSSSLKSLSGNRLKVLIEKTTNNLFRGILTGFTVTVLVQSSSASTVIIIGLIAAGFMTLKQATSVLIGANLGSTATAFIIGLNVSDYSLAFVAIGALTLIFISRKKIQLSGSIIFGFGILFIGLELMSLGLKPITEQPWFANAMTTMSDSTILGVLVGTGLTALIQSSGASIGILQQIFSNGNISLAGALAFLIGSNIGTTITTILASVKSSKEAKQASLFHFLFNLIGTIAVVILFSPYLNLFKYVDNLLGGNSKLTLAFAHIGFNIISSIVIILFTKYIVMLIEKFVPSTKDFRFSIKEKLNYDLINSSPILALESAKIVVLEMGDIAREMVNIARKYQNENNESYFDEVATLEETIDLYDHSIHDYLMEVQTTSLFPRFKHIPIILLDTIRDFERIADHAVNLTEFYKSRHELECSLTGPLEANLNHYFDLIILQIDNAFKAFKFNDKTIAREVITIEQEVNNLERVYRRSQLYDKHSGDSDCADTHFVDILSNLERISDHCNNIADNVIDPQYLSKERS